MLLINLVLLIFLLSLNFIYFVSQ